MSRLEEVEASIKWIMSAGMTGGAITPNMRDLCRTLAAEVDARVEVITKLLAMLKPGEEPVTPVESTKAHWDAWAAHYGPWKTKSDLYARACEIAGRTE